MSTNPNITAEESVRARYGAPYEDEGNCEMCNASGPVWFAGDDDESLPFCAQCILSAEAAGAIDCKEPSAAEIAEASERLRRAI